MAAHLSIQLPFAKLSQWQQIAFCAALIERMLPNYKMFAENSGEGEPKVLRNQLDLVWQWLDKNNRTKINYDAQLLKLEDQTPDPDAHDFFGVYSALDAAMAIMSLFSAMQDKESDGVSNVSRLSENTVSAYVALLIEESNERITEDAIDEHPLMQWEIATQNELFDFLSNAPENKKSCLAAKELILEEGLSNLGIEIG